MRILIHAVAGYSGAGPTHVRELAATVSASDEENDFLFVVQPTLVEEVRRLAPGAAVVAPPPGWARPPARLMWENLRVPKIAAGWRAHVVYSPFNTLPLMWPSPRPRLAVLIFNLAPYADVVLETHALPARLRLGVLRYLTNASITRSDLIFLLSPQAPGMIGGSLRGKTIRFLTVSPPKVQVSPDPRVEIPQEPYFLVAADLVRHKGIETAIEAVARLPVGRRPLLLLCGRPLDQEYIGRLRDQVAEFGIGERVHFVDWVEYQNLLALMQHSVACISPSRFENPGLVPLEAISAGTVALVSRLSVFEESCGDAALYFAVGDARELAKHMLTLLEDGSTRDKLLRAGKARLATAGPNLSQQVLDTLKGLALRS